MKKKLFYLIASCSVLFVIIVCSCNLNPTIPSLDRIVTIIDIRTDSAERMGLAYDALPGVLQDAAGNPFKGIFSDDFPIIKRDYPGTAFLYFKFGIRNYGDLADIQANKKKAVYSLIIIPLQRDSSKFYTALPDKTKYVAYDYGCPCINNQGCCPKN